MILAGWIAALALLGEALYFRCRHDRRNRSVLSWFLEDCTSPLSMFRKKTPDGRCTGWEFQHVLLGVAMAKWWQVTVEWDLFTVIALGIILAVLPLETLVAAVPLTEIFAFAKVKLSGPIEEGLKRASEFAAQVVKTRTHEKDTEVVTSGTPTPTPAAAPPHVEDPPHEWATGDTHEGVL